MTDERQADEEEAKQKKGREKERQEVALFKYVGETNRSCYERGFEHEAARRGFHKNSHMLKHIVEHHSEEDMRKIRFGMKAVRFHRSPFERNIFESVLIQNNRTKHHLLNSKSEFNRCAIPRLGLKMGENEFKEKRQELKDEAENERQLEERIQRLRKNINKHRHETWREADQPKRKKRKLAPGEVLTGEEIPEEERWLEEKLEEEIDKRQAEIDKRKRMEHKRKVGGADIRKYFKKQKVGEMVMVEVEEKLEQYRPTTPHSPILESFPKTDEDPVLESSALKSPHVARGVTVGGDSRLSPPSEKLKEQVLESCPSEKILEGSPLKSPHVARGGTVGGDSRLSPPSEKLKKQDLETSQIENILDGSPEPFLESCPEVQNEDNNTRENNENLRCKITGLGGGWRGVMEQARAECSRAEQVRAEQYTS